MPKLQLINRSPSFGEQLGAGLGQGIAGGINEFFQKKENQKELTGLSPFLEQLGVPKEGIAEILQANVPADRVFQAAQLQSQRLNEQKKLEQQFQMHRERLTARDAKKEEENIQQQKIGQEALDRMAQLAPQVGFGSKLKAKAFGGKTAESVGEFESLSGALEALLVDKVSRGTLSNARFKYITETLLPKANDREATIRGKLKALSKELNLELPGSLEEEKKSENKLNRVEPGTKLDREKAEYFLKKAGNDIEKARKLAKQLGYEF